MNLKVKMSRAATLGVSEDILELVLTFCLGSVNVATRTVDENEHRTWRRSPRLFKKYLNYLEMKPVSDCVSTLEKK